ncbi:MAG: iron chelate uptake ABC transporter family permease subunit [Phycisphaerales bacterium]
MSRRQWVVVVVCGVLVLGAAWVRLSVGNGGFEAPGFDAEGAAYWNLRGLRVVMGVVVGMGLGGAGVMLQSLLRNPLASPDLLGIAAGASLAVTIATYVHHLRTGELVAWGGIDAAAMLGALAVLGLVYVLSQRRGLIDPVTMILLGVVVGIVCAAWIVFVQNLMPDRGYASGRWLLGMLDDDATWWRVGVIGGITLVGVGIGAWLGPWMDAAAMGDDEARSVGVSLGGCRGCCSS